MDGLALQIFESWGEELDRACWDGFSFFFGDGLTEKEEVKVECLSRQQADLPLLSDWTCVKFQGWTNPSNVKASDYSEAENCGKHEAGRALTCNRWRKSCCRKSSQTARGRSSSRWHTVFQCWLMESVDRRSHTASLIAAKPFRLFT